MDGFERNPPGDGGFQIALVVLVVLALLATLAVLPLQLALRPRPAPPKAPALPGLELRDGQPVVVLAREHHGELVDLYSDTAVDLTRLGAFANRILPRLRGWFSPTPGVGTGPRRVSIYLC